MEVGTIMTRPVVTVGPDASLAEVVKAMLDHRIGCVVVVDRHGKLRGIITETDLAAKERAVPFSAHMLPQVFSRLMPGEAIERIREAARTTTAREVMNTDVMAVGEAATVDAVAREMLRCDIDHVPVVQDGMAVGIVSRHDLLRMIVAQAEPA